MSPEERAEQLPVMKALIKVMETDKPDPADVNELLVLTRDLQKNGLNNGKAGFLGGFGAGIGLAGIEGMGLPETGDIIENVDGEPHINTQFGKYRTGGTRGGPPDFPRFNIVGVDQMLKPTKVFKCWPPRIFHPPPALKYLGVKVINNLKKYCTTK